jgi:hypothetical protein
LTLQNCENVYFCKQAAAGTTIFSEFKNLRKLVRQISALLMDLYCLRDYPVVLHVGEIFTNCELDKENREDSPDIIVFKGKNYQKIYYSPLIGDEIDDVSSNFYYYAYVETELLERKIKMTEI